MPKAKTFGIGGKPAVGGRTLVGAALAKTNLPAAVREEVEGIRADLDAEYRDRFIAMTNAISRQASALDRIQHTLELLLEHAAPELRGRIPGLTVAPEGAEADLATVKNAVAADPIGAGYSLGQQAIADALQCSQSDISVLLRGLALKNKPALAVVVRRGPTREIVNYHRRVIDELLRVIEKPPHGASPVMLKAIDRIRRKQKPAPKAGAS